MVGQLRVVKNMMNCLWQSRLTENKMPSSSINSPFFFQACCCCKQLAKHNAKDDARPRAKAAYHSMNELEEIDLDEEDSANEKAELSDNENNSDSDNYNVHRPMNVFPLQLIVTLGATNVTGSKICCRHQTIKFW